VSIAKSVTRNQLQRRLRKADKCDVDKNEQQQQQEEEKKHKHQNEQTHTLSTLEKVSSAMAITERTNRDAEKNRRASIDSSPTCVIVSTENGQLAFGMAINCKVCWMKRKKQLCLPIAGGGGATDDCEF
jgi:hypothetical protein